MPPSQGFSADALRDRINDGHCRYVITADEGLRGGKHIPLKSTVDLALAQCPLVKSCVVYQHTLAPVQMKEGRDLFWAEALELERGYAPCEPMDSEDILFMLFTSGSTGTRLALPPFLPPSLPARRWCAVRLQREACALCAVRCAMGGAGAQDLDSTRLDSTRLD